MSFERTKKKISFRELWNNVDFSKPTTWGLITANLSVIFYAFVDNLTATEVLWMYWIQSVIIGAFNFFRIITLKNFSTEGFKQNAKAVKPTKAAKIFTSIFSYFIMAFFI